VIATHLPRHRPGAPRPRPAHATAPASPAAPGSGTLAPGPADESSGLIGQTLPWDGSLRLPVTGEQPLWLWPAAGRVPPIGGLPRDRYGYQFTRVAGGRAGQAPPRTQAHRRNHAG